MSKELKFRILTSIFLFLLVLFCIFTNKYISIIALTVISSIAWMEFNKLIIKIFYKNNYLRIFLMGLSFLYLVFFVLTSLAIIESSKFYFIYILLICIFSDIGGYIIGKSFGGKKLTKLSPNKTISGSIGSFLFSTFPVFALYLLFIFNDVQGLIINNNNFFHNILLCLSLSLICQLGDIFISYFKRLAKVKDTGNILPGHGGILDRIDGIIFAIPGLILFFIII